MVSLSLLLYYLLLSHFHIQELSLCSQWLKAESQIPESDACSGLSTILPHPNYLTLRPIFPNTNSPPQPDESLPSKIAVLILNFKTIECYFPLPGIPFSLPSTHSNSPHRIMQLSWGWKHLNGHFLQGQPKILLSHQAFSPGHSLLFISCSFFPVSFGHHTYCAFSWCCYIILTWFLWISIEFFQKLFILGTWSYIAYPTV